MARRKGAGGSHMFAPHWSEDEAIGWDVANVLPEASAKAREGLRRTKHHGVRVCAACGGPKTKMARRCRECYKRLWSVMAAGRKAHGAPKRMHLPTSEDRDPQELVNRPPPTINHPLNHNRRSRGEGHLRQPPPWIRIDMTAARPNVSERTRVLLTAALNREVAGGYMEAATADRIKAALATDPNPLDTRDDFASEVNAEDWTAAEIVAEALAYFGIS